MPQILPSLFRLITNRSRADYAWNKNCESCRDKFTTASAFIQHTCRGVQPTTEVKNRRRSNVESELHLPTTQQRGRRIKAARRLVTPETLIPLEVTEGLWAKYGVQCHTTCPSIRDSVGAPSRTVEAMPQGQGLWATYGDLIHEAPQFNTAGTQS